MCGIAGVFTTADENAGRAAVGRMLDASRHRGPDGAGLEMIALPGARLYLGHTRLSILDLSARAAQPMADAESGSWLVYNGEIYNFHELRQELESCGARFTTRGDTEVLLKALVVWGPGGLPRVRGMFAFAYWDGRRRELLLARDPLGIKPLYYARQAGSLVFGSEVKVIQASGLVERSIDREAARSYLVYGAVLGPRTIVRDVRELEPGHLMAVSAGGEVHSPQPYWTRGELLAPAASSPTAPALVSADLRRSVKRHLVSDVGVAVALSGGIDSSLLACLAAEHAPRLHLLTVSFAEKRYCESRYASMVAARTGAEHHLIKLTADDLLCRLPDALAALDQPSVDGINTFVITGVAAGLGIKVLLSGLGGDEVFGGYTSFTKLPLLLRWRPALAALARVSLCTPRGIGSQWHKIGHIRRDAGLTDLYLLQRSIRWEGMAGGLESNRCPPGECCLPPEALRGLAGNHYGDAFHHIASLELGHYLRNQLLRDADVFSMANSVEVRVPYLDLDVVTQAMALPGSCHVRGFQGKQIPRRILAELCPELPLGRRKMGFVFPWVEWLRGPLRSAVAEILHEEPLYETAGIDYAAAAPVCRSFLDGDPLIPWHQVWSLFVLLKWIERNRLSC